MDAQLQAPKKFIGNIRIPPDKAICHRAVLLSSLAEGRSRLHPWPAADDCQRTLQLVKALGVAAIARGDAVEIEGRGESGFSAPKEPLDCGESGTTFRLAAGLLAGQRFQSTLTASPSLLRRPMRRIVEPLSQMGADISGYPGSSKSGEIFPPLVINGCRPLKAIEYKTPVASAQVKSAILLAGLFADSPTTVIEPQPTRDHTERALQAFGVHVTAAQNRVTVYPGKLKSPGEYMIPGDISSAAFFLVAAACLPNASVTITDVGLNPSRAGIIALLKRMGASIDLSPEQSALEPRGTLRVKSSSLKAITVEADEVPSVIDELPILMVAACFAKGVSRFNGVGELRVKETDRIQSMMNGLTRLGAKVRVLEPDTIEVEGQAKLTGAAVDSAGDHRTAMSLCVAALAATGTTTVKQAHCVSKSLPEFFSLLGQIAGPSTVKLIDKA